MTRDPQAARSRRRRVWIGVGLSAVVVVVAVRWMVGGSDDAGTVGLLPSRTAEVEATPAALPAPKDSSPVSVDDPGRNDPASGTYLPRSLGAIDRSKRSFIVRVADALGRPVPDADVAVWSEETSHPKAFALAGAKAAFLARGDSGGDRAFDGPSWRELCWADPTWEAPAHVFKTDAAGRAHLTLPHAVVAIVAMKAGAGTSRCWTGDTGSDIAFELQPRAQLSGQVLDAAGHPVADATVFCCPVAFPSLSKQSLRARRPPPQRTNPEGRFEIDADGGAYARLYALSDGEWSSSTFARLTTEEPEQVTLRFFGALSIEGVVRLPGGAPAADAEVSASILSAFLQTRSAQDGRFRLELADPGRWSLIARSVGYVSPAAEHVQVDASSPTANLVLPLAPTTSIAGHVRWDSGEPAPDFYIDAHPAFTGPDHIDDWSLLRRSLSSFVISAEDGSFRLEGLPALNYSLSAHRVEDGIDSAPGRDVAAGATGVELIVPRADAGLASLTGHVVDDETGSPITSFELRVNPFNVFSDLMDRMRTTVQAADGAFSLELPKESHWLQVRSEGYPPKMIGPLRPGQDDPVEIRLGHLGSISIVVQDETGAPLGAAFVRLREADPGPLALFRPVDERRTQADGRLTWSDLPPGVYDLQANTSNSWSSTTSVSVASGKPCPAVLLVDRKRVAGRLLVTTRHADGRAYPGVTVVAWTSSSSDGRESSLPIAAVSNENGVATLGPMMPGECRIFTTKSREFIPQKAKVEAGETVTVELTARK